jgi:ketosteroid isomerase-like protein
MESSGSRVAASYSVGDVTVACPSPVVGSDHPNKGLAMQLVWRDTAQVTSKNVELVRKDLEYWNRGDIDAFVGLWDDDVVLRAAEGWPERVHRGKDAVRSFYEGFADTVGRDSVIEDLVDAGDVVVTRMRAHMTGLHSGLEGDMRFSQVTTFRNGKVVLAEFFWDHQEALEAAAVSE